MYISSSTLNIYIYTYKSGKMTKTKCIYTLYINLASGKKLFSCIYVRIFNAHIHMYICKSLFNKHHSNVYNHAMWYLESDCSYIMYEIEHTYASDAKTCLFKYTNMYIYILYCISFHMIDTCKILHRIKASKLHCHQRSFGVSNLLKCIVGGI